MFMKRIGAVVGAAVLGFGSLTLASAAAFGAATMPAAQFAATSGTASCFAGDSPLRATSVSSPRSCR